ncbi:hypothetical protein Patl1_29488 [Pistacia atlantica]|uniref:Uncharacterized protein n=1 Tax=Pistacia atlantica TaxID=434234 RepID=A0ACC1AB75_9ROSI|nr:hypothetical protein Patl1_29488 [Pistacia atlantica]
MKEWEDWISHGPDLEAAGFSNLKELFIVKCSKLVGRLLEHLPSLGRLVIKSCRRLLVSIPRLRRLCRLEIDGCKEIMVRSTMELSSLNSVVLSDVSSPAILEQFMRGLWQVKDLKIVGCKELTSLCQNGLQLLQNISSLDQLVIEHCPQLLSLAAEEEEEHQQQLLPCRLQYLELRDCNCLVKLPQALLNITSLRKIYITKCPNLISFPEVGLPGS